MRDGLGNRIGPPEFGPDLVRKYQVSGVPKTVANETVNILGVRPEEDFVRTAAGGANPR